MLRSITHASTSDSSLLIVSFILYTLQVLDQSPWKLGSGGRGRPPGCRSCHACGAPSGCAGSGWASGSTVTFRRHR